MEAWIVKDSVNANEYREQIREVKRESRWFFTIDGSIESGWKTKADAENIMNEWLLDNPDSDATVDVERLY